MTKAMVIIGAGMAGGNAAATLRGEGYRERVVLIGDEPEAPFGRPPLSKGYLRGEEDLSGWLVKPAEWYEANDVERVMARVVAIDTAAREVTLASGQRVAYAQLLIATGGRKRVLAVPGARLSGVLGLRTVADCEAIRQAARPGAHAVVVGMGFIGSEVAASLRQMGVDVTAVLTGAGPLAKVLGDEVASVLGAIHREKGVELVLDDRLVAFAGDGRVERAVTADGKQLVCDFAVVGAGIEPAVDCLDGSGIAVDDGVLVDESCRTNMAGVFAAGDIANQLHPIFGRIRVEHYNSSEHQGRAVARAMLGSDEPFADIHTFWSDQYEHTIEYVGHASTWDQFVVRGSLEERAFLGFYLERGRLKAVMGLDRGGDPELEEDSELFACKALVRDGVTIDTSVLADEAVDIRDLAVG
jgi:3-phenylpropionate/trans-cinnamate dioxygenase ferredoxin reductase subunit